MKKQKLSPESSRMLKGAIAYIRQKGFHEIKTLEDGFKDPRAVFTKAEDAGYTPHVIAEKDFGTYIFEVIDGSQLENWEEHSAKWHTFEAYARKRSGKLYFITYDEDAELVTSKLQQMNIEPSLIKIIK